MTSATRRTVVEMSRGATTILTALVLVAGLAWKVGKPSAMDFIDQTVESKLKKLEDRIDKLDRTGQNLAVQQTIQQQQTEFLIKQTDDTSGDVKEIQHDIKTLLRALSDR